MKYNISRFSDKYASKKHIRKISNKVLKSNIFGENQIHLPNESCKLIGPGSNTSISKKKQLKGKISVQPDCYNINLHTSHHLQIPDVQNYNLLKQNSPSHSIDKNTSYMGTRTPNSHQKLINFNNITQEICLNLNFPSNLEGTSPSKVLRFKKKKKKQDCTKHISIDDKKHAINGYNNSHNNFNEEHTKSSELINKNLKKRNALKKHLQ